MALEATEHTSLSGWLGLVTGAIRGSFWGPLGFESPRALCILSAKFYCFLSVTGARKQRLGFPPSKGPSFIMYFFLTSDLSLHLELNSGMLKALWNPLQRFQRFSEHSGIFLFPKDKPVGKASSCGNWDCRKNPKALLPAVQHPYRMFWGDRYSWWISGSQVAMGGYFFT